MSDLISRQAAVEKILRNKDAKPLNESDYQDGIRAGLDIAYCEIRDMSSAEPVDCTNFIRWIRDKVMDEEDWNLNAEAYGEVICRKLKKLGAVFSEGGYYHSAEQVHGEWLHEELIPNDINGHVHGECPVCHKVRIVDNYCPNCGAKMKGAV